MKYKIGDVVNVRGIGVPGPIKDITVVLITEMHTEVEYDKICGCTNSILNVNFKESQILGIGSSGQ